MKVLEIQHNDTNEILHHAPRPDGNDYTLCGLALEGVEGDWSAASDGEGKVTCSDCTKIIRYCKTIRPSNISA